MMLKHRLIPNNGLGQRIPSTPQDMIKLKNTYSGCPTSIDYLAISPDASLLATSDESRASLDLWDMNSLTLIKTIPIAGEHVTDITFSPNSQLLGWASSIGGVGIPFLEASIELYDINENRIKTSLFNVADIVTALHIFEDEPSVVFIGSQYGYLRANIQVWDVVSNTNIATREAWDIAPAFTNNTLTAYLGTTLSLGITNEFRYQIEQWDAQTNTLLQESDVGKPISVLAVNNNFSRLALGDEEGVISLWDTEPLTYVSDFQARNTKIQYLAFINDDHLITSSLENNERYVQVWDVEAQAKLLLERNLGQVRVETFALYIENNELIFANADDVTFGISTWNYEDDTLRTINLSCP